MESQTTNGNHDIFLSHSGKQKGFVKDLYGRLTSFYTLFFDLTDHSLPPAEKFPPRIFEGASKCKLAVVVLSNDFVVSYWPMVELCAFVRASPSVQILPLFYHLSPLDLKNEDNLEKWRVAWRTHAARKSNSKHPLDVMEWEEALESLCTLNGVTFNPSIEGEEAYLDKIVSKISKIVSPSVKYDDMGIHGKDRLCKIILTKFEELEARMLQPCNEQSVPSQSRVCILAMYGLPGSGKSTICKCLCNHYFPYFDGKTHYIELPTNPTNEELAKKCKELLDRLTNFRNMVDLTHISDLRQIYYVLKTRNVQSARIFLVLDNISEETLEFVHNILRFGVGLGSKVLLVARTLDVLRSFLDHQIKQSHWVSASMKVPSLNEKEAIRVLLQRRENEDLADHDFTTHDTQIMEKVVYMSGFGTKQQRLYLPLVIQLMGAQLRQYKLDVRQWSSVMDNFWTSIEKCKERAVMKLVQESFLQLSECHQLLFLDLALFVRRLSTVDDVSQQMCNILSIMHHRSLTDITMDIYDLQRHCFVEDVNPTRIHDVFLEFAASIPKSAMYYVSCGSCSPVDRMVPPSSSKALEFGLRAVVVEELSEEHNRFEFWPGFSNVKALVFRNCEKLTVLGLKGLTSLAILIIENCPSLKLVELPVCEADCRKLLDSIQWLRWADREGAKNMVLQHKTSNNTAQMYAKQGEQLVSNAWSWFGGMDGGIHVARPARMLASDLPFRMRGLQALDLQNTGIKHMKDLSKCWPLLKEMTIIEESLELIEVGTLPCLKRFLLSCDNKPVRIGVCLASGPRGYCKFEAKNLLVGCPALEEVAIRSASFEDGLGTLVAPKLRSLLLANFWHAEKLPDLAQSLESLEALECEDLRSVDFMCRFEQLSSLLLVGCPSITEISGLNCLPSLRHLCINNCINLHTLRGLSGLVSLRVYFVGLGCPNLQVPLSDLAGLTNLIDLEHHSNNLQSELEGFTVQKLANVQKLLLYTNRGTSIESMECLPVPYCHSLLDLATLVGVPEPSHLSSCLTSIFCLHLEGVQNLARLRGIEFLHLLVELQLKSLSNLSCLQGIEALTNLEVLGVGDCVSVEELPSLSQLLKMRRLVLENCVKLRRVEGCDAMTQLGELHLVGCKSMACFPLDYTFSFGLRELRVEGSLFASSEALVLWILDDEKPFALHEAAERGLKWELCRTLREKPTEKIELAGWLLERLDRTRLQKKKLDRSCACSELSDICEQVALGNNKKICDDQYDDTFLGRHDWSIYLALYIQVWLLHPWHFV